MNQVLLQTETFTNVVLTDESEYPCYRFDLKASSIADLVERGIIDIDPSYQRGKTAPTTSRPSLPIHALKRNVDHIESLRNDITHKSWSGRTIAIIPPIWCNARTNSGVANLIYNEETFTLHFLPGVKCFTVDGWHRILAIRKAFREGEITDRKFTIYLLNGPVELEARAFRLLNAAGLPVERTRVAWVSAPFSDDMYRVAYEFIMATPSFSYNGELNIEIVKSTVVNGSTAWCSFLAISNGFTTPVQPNWHLWPEDQIDPTSSRDRQVVVDYMRSYWAEVIKVLPPLDFMSISARKKSRETYPLLVNNVMAQVLIWIGHTYLLAYKSSSSDYLTRLKELQDPAKRSLLFHSLRKLSPSLFTDKVKIWDGLTNSKGKFTKNDFKGRRDVYLALVKYLGIDIPNSIDTTIQNTITIKQKPKSPEITK